MHADPTSCIYRLLFQQQDGDLLAGIVDNKSRERGKSAAGKSPGEYFSTSVDNLFLKWSDHDTACDET
jgi:hypothetical protein